MIHDPSPEIPICYTLILWRATFQCFTFWPILPRLQDYMTNMKQSWGNAKPTESTLYRMIAVNGEHPYNKLEIRLSLHIIGILQDVAGARFGSYRFVDKDKKENTSMFELSLNEVAKFAPRYRIFWHMPSDRCRPFSSACLVCSKRPSKNNTEPWNIS